MNPTAPMCLALICLAASGCATIDQDACVSDGFGPSACYDEGSNPAADAIISGMRHRQQEEQLKQREQLTYQPSPFRI